MKQKNLFFYRRKNITDSSDEQMSRIKMWNWIKRKKNSKAQLVTHYEIIRDLSLYDSKQQCVFSTLLLLVKLNFPSCRRANVVPTWLSWSWPFLKRRFPDFWAGAGKCISNHGTSSPNHSGTIYATDLHETYRCYYWNIAAPISNHLILG